MKQTIAFIFTTSILCLSAVISGCSDSNDSTPAVDLTPLLERYVLSSMDSVPEGIAFDEQDRAFFATSLNGASITRIDAQGNETLFREADNSATLVGAKVDSERRKLWVCAREVMQSGSQTDNRVWVFDLGTGEATMEFLLGAIATNGSCNDLALDSAGNAYVTDSSNPNVYRLDGTSGEGTLLVSDPLFADVTTLGLGLNGIAVQSDDSGLIVGKFAPASLFHIALDDSNAITPITLSGDALPSPDGLAFLGADLYTVADSAVSKIQLSNASSAGAVTTVEQISGLSTATVAEGALYVIKSEVTRSVLNAPLQLPFEIFKVDLSAF
ncbi:MAG: SMP-30/gluconolactonase/LRE family protein [Halioglobus sp.]